MTPTKEELTREVIIALKDFLDLKTTRRHSCTYVSRHLETVFKYAIKYVYYKLTEEVLEISEDAYLYRHSLAWPFDRFSTTEETRLRKRFVELTIKNLESGIFALETSTYAGSRGNACMGVRLVLNPNVNV